MNHIEDERVVFYLKHQRRIEEWAALGEDAALVAHEFLCSLADDLDRFAEETSAEIIVQKDPDDPAYPSLLLALPGWYTTESREVLRAGVGITWHRTTNLGFTIPERCAYSGVWTYKDIDGGPELSRQLKGAFAAAGLLKEHGLKSSVWWPAYRWEIASGEFWKDLSPYREQILASIRLFWSTFAPLMRTTLDGAAT